MTFANSTNSTISNVTNNLTALLLYMTKKPSVKTT